MQSCINRFHNAIHILGDVIVPEPQHAIAFFLQPARARFVVRILAIFGVLRAVDFDQQAAPPCRQNRQCRDRSAPGDENASHRDQVFEDDATVSFRHRSCCDEAACGAHGESMSRRSFASPCTSPPAAFGGDPPPRSGEGASYGCRRTAAGARSACRRRTRPPRWPSPSIPAAGIRCPCASRRRTAASSSARRRTTNSFRRPRH